MTLYRIHVLTCLSQSIDWFDAPDSIRYARFDDETQEIQSPGLEKPVGSTSPSNMSNSSSNTNCSHLISFGFREVQEAMKELDIASQVSVRNSHITMATVSMVTGPTETFLDTV